MNGPYWEVFGRLHIVLLHFPIALIIAALFIEVASLPARRRGVIPADAETPRPIRTGRPASPAAAACLSIGAIGAALSAWTGWMFAAHEFPADSAVTLHRWFGIAAAAIALIAAAFALAALRGRATRMYRGILVLAAAIVGFTGHLGGELVHGENFLFSPLGTPSPDPAPQPAPEVPPAVPAAALTFEADVLPILATHCTRCHGDQRQRGGVRLDSAEAIADVITPGDASGSLLIEVLLLSPDDDRHMPKNEESLDPASIDVLREWIDAQGR